MQCLLVKVVGVCLKRSLLCLRRVTPGLCAVMVDGGTDFAFSVGKPAFRQHLALVSSLNTHIFLFHLMDFVVGVKPCFGTHRPGSLFCQSRGLFRRPSGFGFLKFLPSLS